MAGFNDGTAIADDAIKSRTIDWAATGGGDTGGIWWEELGRTTLGVAGDAITVDSLPTRKYLLIVATMLASGNTTAILRFNNDSGNNYSFRVSNDGGADSAQTSQSNIQFRAQAGALNQLGIAEVVNVADRDKEVFIKITARPASAAAAPNRAEGAGYWDNSSVAISRVDVVNAGAGDFAAGSEALVLGHN